MTKYISISIYCIVISLAYTLQYGNGQQHTLWPTDELFEVLSTPSHEMLKTGQPIRIGKKHNGQRAEVIANNADILNAGQANIRNHHKAEVADKPVYLPESQHLSCQHTRAATALSYFLEGTNVS